MTGKRVVSNSLESTLILYVWIYYCNFFVLYNLIIYIQKLKDYSEICDEIYIYIQFK